MSSENKGPSTPLVPKSDVAGPKPGDSQWKDNNPKAGFGASKVGIDYLSLPVLFEQSIGMMAGGYKYGAHNYLEIAPSVMTYVSALFRHVGAFVGGEEYDPHAGPGVKVHHLVAGMNCLHVIRAAMIQGNFFDDRPPQMPEGFIDSLSESVKAIQANNPEPVARYLAHGQRGPGRILETDQAYLDSIGQAEFKREPNADLHELMASPIWTGKPHDQASRELDALARSCCNTDPRLEKHASDCNFAQPWDRKC